MQDQLADIKKEVKENKEQLNSLMMLPQKTEYIVSDVKKELIKIIEAQAIENKGEIKELRSYIHTLHSDIQSNLSKITKLQNAKG